MGHRVELTYCVPRDCSDRAVRTVADLLGNYQHISDDLTLVTAGADVRRYGD